MKAYLSVSIAVFIAASTVWATPAFQGLGDLPGGEFYSTATAVSSDGTVVVGQSRAEAGWVAFRWTESGGIQSLGDLPGGPVESVAFGVSPDGSAVTGWSKVATQDREAFVWTDSGGMKGLGDLPGGSFFSVGRGVTNGGTRVVGSANNAMGWEAMYWSQGSGLVGLGDLGGDYSTSVMAVTPDGMWYAGSGRNSSGTVAFVASVGGAKQQLGELPGGNYSSTAYGISPDGTIVVGVSNSANGAEAFVWSSATGMKALGDLPGGTFSSSAHGVSADGKVIVGMGKNAAGFRAVMWDQDGKIVDLNTLVAEAGINLGDWVLESASAVTPDGKTIIGDKSNSQYATEGWILHLGGADDPMAAVWGDCQAFSNGWHLSPWYDWFNASYYPLMWHSEHGWQLCQADSPASILFYDHGLSAWVWTNPATYPYLFLYGSNPGWLYYLKAGQPGHRWFFHYDTNSYFNEESL